MAVVTWQSCPLAFIHIPQMLAPELRDTINLPTSIIEVDQFYTISLVENAQWKDIQKF